MRPNLSSRLINLAGVVISIYLIVILVQTVRNNANLQSQNQQLQSDITNLQQQNNDLTFQIAYFKTRAYQDKAARAKLGLQAPGEHVIIFPQKQSATESAGQTPTQPTAKPQANWLQWWHFLFG